MRIGSHKELQVYQRAFDAAMEIFRLTKRFPVEERYPLTDHGASGATRQRSSAR